MEQEITDQSQIKSDDEQFCHECGRKIQKKDPACPHCGTKQKGQVSKVALVLLAFFVGGIGMHKFYLGKYWQGIFYVLLCWSGIPGIIALIEAVIYMCTSNERLNEKYTASGNPVIIAIVAVIFGVFIAGILAAIAIPQFMMYQERAKELSSQPETGQMLLMPQMERGAVG